MDKQMHVGRSIVLVLLWTAFIFGTLALRAFADYTVTFHNQTKNIRCAGKFVTVDWDNRWQNNNKAYSLGYLYTGQSETLTVPDGDFKCTRILTKINCWIQSEHKWVPQWTVLGCQGGSVYLKSYDWGGVYTEGGP